MAEENVDELWPPPDPAESEILAMELTRMFSEQEREDVEVLERVAEAKGYAIVRDEPNGTVWLEAGDEKANILPPFSPTPLFIADVQSASDDQARYTWRVGFLSAADLGTRAVERVPIEVLADENEASDLSRLLTLDQGIWALERRLERAASAMVDSMSGFRRVLSAWAMEGWHSSGDDGGSSLAHVDIARRIWGEVRTGGDLSDEVSPVDTVIQNTDHPVLALSAAAGMQYYLERMQPLRERAVALEVRRLAFEVPLDSYLNVKAKRLRLENVTPPELPDPMEVLWPIIALLVQEDVAAARGCVEELSNTEVRAAISALSQEAEYWAIANQIYYNGPDKRFNWQGRFVLDNVYYVMEALVNMLAVGISFDSAETFKRSRKRRNNR